MRSRAGDAGAMDDTAKAIIAMLQRDGRAPYATIAREVGLSEAAVRARVQRLLENETLQIVAVTDPTQVGFQRQALIGITVRGDIQKVADQLARLDEAAYVVVTAGRYDILIEVVCEDDDHLLKLLGSRIRAVDGVAQTETLMYLNLTKQRYDWGTR
ncbi:Lrp/AsnC family transcriptional regulator [Branchiibius sp. NY16-3462-2]|uniref:Lrp/AsnC family transcriptional regulator n=1 Tax=Branchiibius sp. NY16-3462-2 TaxID=1807500 RepID=UPI000798E66B|nr:AsnC family transcriptional regulator [Branchiibius sp. NY16-3462-2]